MAVKSNQLTSLASRLGVSKMKMLLVIERGLGCHSAGLVMEGRRLVKQIFRDGLHPYIFKSLRSICPTHGSQLSSFWEDVLPWHVLSSPKSSLKVSLVSSPEV